MVTSIDKENKRERELVVKKHNTNFNQLLRLYSTLQRSKNSKEKISVTNTRYNTRLKYDNLLIAAYRY